MSVASVSAKAQSSPQCNLVPTPPVVTDVNQAWVQLFDDKGFIDRCLTVPYGVFHRDFHSVRSDDGKKGFNDKTSSLRYQIPVGWQAVLYDDNGWRDSPYYLIGTGRVEEIPDLGSYSDKASSIAWQRIPGREN
ncbi:MAG: hypothetical protein HC769_18880 [Cyanobacteria bacterium CRU_2_1]|nr:hypothetical protein [Cyanobacteria bacterium CRU_2_1]